MKRAPKMGRDKLIIVNLSGRGDKDVAQVVGKGEAVETHFVQHVRPDSAPYGCRCPDPLQKIGLPPKISA